MGTYAFVALPASHISSAGAIFDAMRRAEKSLSSFRSDGGVARLNEKRSIKADTILLKSLSYCRKLYEITDGYFDCTIGSLTKKLYRFGTDEEAIPSKSEREAAAVSMKGVKITGEIVELDEGRVLDLGGLGKGVGVDLAAAEALKSGVESGIIGIGGDIRCLGPCRVDIQNPFGDGTVGTVRNGEGQLAVSTSGTYRRYIGSSRYNHLLDPYKKESAGRLLSVTLAAKLPNALLDGLATAAAVMPVESAMRLVASQKTDALFIAADGSILRFGRGIEVKPAALGGFVLHPSLSLQEAARYMRREGR